MASHEVNPETPEARALLEKVCSSKTLPSVPVVAANILTLCKDPDVDFAKLGEMTSADAALVAKLLQMANSAFFASHQKVFSVNAAVVRMGLKVTRIAVLGFSLETEISGKMPEEFKVDRFWRYSLTTASAARVIAETVCPAQRDECFSAGILQDIGMVALQCALPEEYAKVLAEHRLHPTVEIHDLEKRLLGVTHTEVGSRLLRQWNLPEEVYAPIRYHHGLDQAMADGLSPDLVQVARTLVLGTLVAALFQGKTKGITYKRVIDTAQRYFGLEPEAVELMFGKIEKVVRSTCELFQVDPRSMPAYEQIRLRATHEVARLAAELGQEARSAENLADQRTEELRQLKQESDELRRLISLDDLTLLLNRREFLKRFMAEIVRSRRHEHELALVMVDIDDFKSVNDTYGHAAGDEVLKHLGGFLQAESRKSDVAARVGGDEFVVMLPETDLDGAIAAAEKLRFGIATSSKGWTQRVPGITVSVGVVHSRYSSHSFDEGIILDQADKCMYQAKRDGRNCTRYATI
ncbi:MAG: GGDEF domain-containing protein [Candidatus Brocadiia bacterium]|jgi:diguanylate cyclase (GGDEF)-like protein